MMLINCSNISKMYGTETVIAPSSFAVNDGDKIGLVGVNGAGKTTLFKMLLGELSCDSGEIYKSNNLKIKYLEQYVGYNSDKTVIEIITDAFSDVVEVEKQLNEVTKEMEIHADDKTILMHHELSERYNELDGFTYKNRIKSTLLGLGFTEKDFNKNFSDLSGGQKTRVMLCKILLGGADLLLLDEPTNHLDLKSISWLEDFLSDYKGSFVVVSHDRYFLDKVTNKTAEIDNGKINTYNGNYSKYVVQKEEREKTAERKYKKQTEEIAKLEGIIKQQKQWNREKNIKTAESKQKAIDRIKEDMEIPQSAQESVHFSFKRAESCGNEILVCKDLKMGFDGKTLFSDGNMFIKKQDRVFITGDNGCGKTTLLKIINSELTPLEGEFKLGSNVKIGYFDQTQECLNLGKTAFQQISDDYPFMTNTEIRNALASFLFKGDDVFKYISDLSGGERARVALLKLLLCGANFLILDEPTNHLDIQSREALEKALQDYDGTILAVSHDRYFMDKLATKIYNVSDKQIKEYAFGYKYFVEQINNRNKQVSQQKAEAVLSYKEKKKAEAEKRKIENMINKTEQQIAEVEEKIEELKQQLMLPEIATDYLKATEITEEIEKQEYVLMELYEVWEQYNQEEF